MRTLGDPNENESRAVEARQELDLKIGVAFSRYQTQFFKNKYSDLDSAVISYGPCQIPTLGFCVDRFDLIQHFKGEVVMHFHNLIFQKYWSAQLTIKKDNRTIPLTWSRGRIFDLEIYSLFQKQIQPLTSVEVISIKETNGARTRPLPLNTVEMLKIASRSLGMGPKETMVFAERLYLKGYISYPRTESTSYPVHYNLLWVENGWEME